MYNHVSLRIAPQEAIYGCLYVAKFNDTIYMFNDIIYMFNDTIYIFNDTIYMFNGIIYMFNDTIYMFNDIIYMFNDIIYMFNVLLHIKIFNDMIYGQRNTGVTYTHSGQHNIT